MAERGKYLRDMSDKKTHTVEKVFLASKFLQKQSPFLKIESRKFDVLY